MRLLTVVGGVGFLAAVAAVYKGMRQVMVTSGGFCASGGPYTIAPGHQCTSSDVDLVVFGIIGMLVLGGVALAAAAAADWSSLMLGLVAWAVLFGVLGLNFVSLGFSPPHGQSGAGGWIITGIVFWLMALGGLVPVISGAFGWMRRGGQPEPPTAPAFPLVRAVVNQDRPPRTGGV
ncbi:MAG TPA: hypothetical protein VGF36_16150 [Rhodopila sp.]